MEKIARVRKFSRHDELVIAGNKYTKDQWLPIDENIKHEELTIIDKDKLRKPKKKERSEEDD